MHDTLSETTSRKLATIRRISAICEIEGADAIEVALVDGWKVVVKKGEFQPGDLVIYFEIDSFLPILEEFEFLRKSSYKNCVGLGEGFRLKTIKLRKQISQGLLMPMSTFFDKDEDGNWIQTEIEDLDTAKGEVTEDSVVFTVGMTEYILEEGDDVTDHLGVQKYEAPLHPSLAGTARGNFPSFIRKTDQERIQNCHRQYLRRENKLFEATLKLDGSSMTVYRKDGVIGVCSRNLDLVETPENTFWKVARSSGLIDFLESGAQTNLAFQGELMGPGVQGNREGLTNHKMFLFDIFDIDDQFYYSPMHRREVFTDMLPHLDPEYFDHAPIVEDFVYTDWSVEDFLKYAERKSINHPIAEGVVFKSFDGEFSFKSINNLFLLKEE